ncbi:recombinase family protein [Oscillospiraceae bacterium OttesenSCG-928-G22]|nr:recombinase family protein [Oscillospiraceae bacterium OttesenSCG-928-G22]
MPRIRKNKKSLSQASEPYWKIGLYIRLSREDEKKSAEKEEDSDSIINQDKILKDFVSEHFNPGSYTIVDVFADDGLTGTDTMRPEFKRLEKCIENKEVNCVIVKSLSRAFRNSADQTKFLEEFLPRHGTRFINTGSPFIDTLMNPQAASGIEVSIHGIFNDKFAAVTSEEVRKVLTNKMKNGEFIGAFAPYGYNKDPEDKNRLIIDSNAAQTVQNIFHWFVNDGISKNGIALKLNQAGEPNPTEYKKRNGRKYCNPNSHKNDGLWSESTVSRILKDPIYIGTMRQGRTRRISHKIHDPVPVPEEEWIIVPDNHEALVDKEVFAKAQLLHEKDTRTAPGESHVHMFAGFMRCPDCEKAMRRKPSGKNGKYVYYVCRTNKDKHTCTTHSIREDKLEQAVLAAIQMQILMVDSLAEEIERINNAPVIHRESARLTHSLKQAEEQSAKLTHRRDGLYEDWKNGDISKEDYHRLKNKYAEQLKEIEVSISHIKEEMQIMSSGIELDDPYLTAFLKHKNIQSLSRGILVELVDTIWVYEGGGIMIDFNFADQFQRIVDYIENNRNNLILLEKKAAV